MKVILAVLAVVASANAGYLNYGVGSVGVAPAVDVAHSVGVARTVVSPAAYQTVQTVPAVQTVQTVQTVPAVSTYSVGHAVPAVHAGYTAPVAAYSAGWNQGNILGGFLKK